MTDQALIDDPEARAAARRYLVSRVVIYGLLGAFALVYLLPLFVVVFNSFRDLPEIAVTGRSNGQKSSGSYLVVWKKQKDGTWKIHIDASLPAESAEQ